MTIASDLWPLTPDLSPFQALTTIIQRDFFPDVPKLEAQLEFIEASERNDYDKLRQISERFATTSHTPGGPGELYHVPHSISR